MKIAEDKVAILDLYAEYNRSIDAGDADAWVKTFSADGVFHHPARTYAGAVELREFIEARTVNLSSAPASNQLHWNDSIVIAGEGLEVSARCGLLVSGIARTNGKPLVLTHGSYADKVVKTSQGWRFAERRLIVR